VHNHKIATGKLYITESDSQIIWVWLQAESQLVLCILIGLCDSVAYQHQCTTSESVCFDSSSGLVQSSRGLLAVGTQNSEESVAKCKFCVA